ncbi:hypothetical protein PN409_16425 [Halorubrum ezzemoulense]|nr:hypothetical protein [Halorubrum ezzemoulense]
MLGFTRERLRRRNSEETNYVSISDRSSLVLEGFDPVIKIGKYCCEHVPPVIGIVGIRSGCRCIGGLVEVFAGIMIVRVSVPSALARRSGAILFRVVDAEVVGLEPANPEIRTGDATWKVSEVVLSDDRVRCVLRSGLDVVEPVAAGEVCGDPVEDFCIDGTTTR